MSAAAVIVRATVQEDLVRRPRGIEVEVRVDEAGDGRFVARLDASDRAVDRGRGEHTSCAGVDRRGGETVAPCIRCQPDAHLRLAVRVQIESDLTNRSPVTVLDDE